MNVPKLILIADDDPDDVELFQEAVKEIDPDIKCISAKDGKEAIDILNSSGPQLPDVIFLDLNMPRVNGKQCLREIKRNYHLSHIPVIIYSTTRQQDDEEEFKKLGAREYLIKPSSFSEIRNSIQSILLKLPEGG